MGVPLLEKDANGLRVTWGGHATVLIEIDGVRLVTAPVLRSRVVHLRRHAPDPGPAFVEGIDAVLISHLHFDHLDLPTLRRYGRGTRIVVPAGAGALIRRAGFAKVTEMLAGETVDVGGVEILTAAKPGQFTGESLQALDTLRRPIA